MTQRARFSQADVTRAVRAVKAAGEPVSRVVVNQDGSIVVYCGEPTDKPDRVNPLDRLLGIQR